MEKVKAELGLLKANAYVKPGAGVWKLLVKRALVRWGQDGRKHSEQRHQARPLCAWEWGELGQLIVDG